MTKPSKAELKEMADGILASDCVSGNVPNCPRINLVRIAAALRALAMEKEDSKVAASGIAFCPFCGGFGLLVTSGDRTAQWITCSVCGVCSPRETRREHAIAAWNRRSTRSQPYRAELEETKVETLREAARRLFLRDPTSASEDTADLCAIVLRKYLALLKLFAEHVTKPVSTAADVQR